MVSLIFGVFLTVLVCDDYNGRTVHAKEFADSLQFKSIVSVHHQICKAHRQLIDWQPQYVSSNWLVVIVKLVVNNSVLS